MNLKKYLQSIGACEEALKWVGDKSLQEAWATCERGDWMLWLAQRAGVDLRTLTTAKAECAALALPYTKDPRVIAAIETARKFGRGEISEQELKLAAASAAYAAYAAASAYAAYAASDAAYAADAAAYAAADAAAYAAASAAYADASAAKRKEILLQCAEIVRGIITEIAIEQ